MKVVAVIHDIEQKLKKELKHETVCNQYAWWLLEKLTKKSKADLLIADEITLSEDQEHELAKWVDQIANKHKPIAYILGTVPFGTLDILVRPPILIPRPETEEWVLKLADQLAQLPDKKELLILDLGAGSGCIGLTLANKLPFAHIYASDISQQAIALAQENKERLGIGNVSFMHADLFDGLPEDIKFDLIVSNPPYITPEEYEKLEPSVLAWEDKGALVAPRHGLAIIEKIIEQTPAHIRPNKQLYDHGVDQLYLEIGWQQGQAVKTAMQENRYTDIEIHKDSAGKDRVVSGRIPYVAIAAD